VTPVSDTARNRCGCRATVAANATGRRRHRRSGAHGRGDGQRPSAVQGGVLRRGCQHARLRLRVAISCERTETTARKGRALALSTYQQQFDQLTATVRPGSQERAPTHTAFFAALAVLAAAAHYFLRRL
jgi:hypothetical protein